MIYLYVLLLWGLSLGYSFYEGYIYNNQSTKINLLVLENKRLTLAQSYYKNANEIVKAENEKALQVNLDNEAIINELRKTKSVSSGNGIVVNGDFLRATDRIK